MDSFVFSLESLSTLVLFGLDKLRFANRRCFFTDCCSKTVIVDGFCFLLNMYKWHKLLDILHLIYWFHEISQKYRDIFLLQTAINWHYQLVIKITPEYNLTETMKSLDVYCMFSIDALFLSGLLKATAAGVKFTITIHSRLIIYDQQAMHISVVTFS